MRIELEKAANTRDLGGIKTKFGKTIKCKKLLRSGKLYYATNNDIEKLENEYQLRKIIDFRNNHEMKKTPDPMIHDVQYVHIPILEEHYISTANSKDKNIHAPDIDYLKHIIEEMNFDVESFSIREYPKMLSDTYSRNQFKKFLEELLKETKGAILYHCSAGKDRVGIATLLLLGILGVSKEDIIKDYCETNIYLAKRIENYSKLAIKAGLDAKYINQLPALCGVQESYILSAFDYIESHSSSIEEFVQLQLDFDKSKIEQLRKTYCE